MRLISAVLSLMVSCTSFASVHEFIARGRMIQAGTEPSPLAARLYVTQRDQYQNILLLNPGGLIPALAMSGLAEALAQKGMVVFVLENPNNLPIQAINLPADFAAALRNKLEQIADMPTELKTPAIQSLPIKALGHSLGGAVLGAEIGNTDSLFQEIILVGVSRLVATPKKAAVKVTFLLGEKDGLASRSSVDQLAASFGTLTQLVAGVNHFCIISDANAGAPDKKAQDLPTDLTSSQCVERVVALLQ